MLEGFHQLRCCFGLYAECATQPQLVEVLLCARLILK